MTLQLVRSAVSNVENGGTRRFHTVADLRAGDHACFIHGNEQEHQSVVVSFVQRGLDERQRVLYVHDARSHQQLTSMLRDAGVEVDRAEARRQLVFVHAKQMFVRGAGYSIERVLDQLHAMTAMALADGWTGLRVTSEMTWLLRQTQGLDRILDQEGRMGAFYRASAALGLAQYDRGKFPAPSLIDVLLSYPVAVVGTEAVQNFYYTPDVETSGSWRSEVTLGKWLSNLKERKRASENLREALQLHREVLDNVGSGIVVIDREGRVVQCNAFMERFLGLPGIEVQGRHLSEFLPALGRDSFEDVFARVLAGEIVLSPDMIVARSDKDGSSWVIATMAPYRDPDGVVIGGIAALSDITSRKEVEAALRSNEEQLRQTQKLEAVGRLAGGVAHDMNNALNAIIAFADLALQGAGEDEPLRGDIKEIRSAADRAASITRRLLAFSSRQVLQFQTIDLNEIVEGVEGMLRRLVGEQTALTMRLVPEICNIKTDPSQIEQVIINLALNARDAMPNGGSLIIETDIVELERARKGVFETITPGEYAVLRIRDSGCGMSPEILAHAFEPFFTTKDMARGSGLGLPVVYGIVKQSGGQICVQSEIGQGTCVEIYLARTANKASREDFAGSVFGNETVLLVEDEDLVRKVVARILEQAGYRVLVAANGQQALELCHGLPTPIDVLVTDVMMPGMGGKELANRVTALCPSTRVLFMTGYTEDEVLRRGILDQGRAILLKPFAPQALLRRLREILTGES